MKTMKRIFERVISIVLIAAMLAGTVFAANTTETAVKLGELVSGKLTLGEFATACVYYFELQGQEPAENTFTDLDSDAEHATDILRLAARGAVKGYPDGTVRPDEIVTKVRAYTILARAMVGLDADNQEFVKLPPNVTAVMCDPDFWLAQVKDPDRVLMTADEIAELNAACIKEDTGMYDLDNMPEKFAGKKLAETLGSFETPSAHYLDGKLLKEKYYEKVRKNVKGVFVHESQTLRFGFIVNQTVMRSMATTDAITSSLSNPEEDDFALTSLRVNEPVVIYFSTRDGSMTYVACNHCIGWVPTVDLAICSSRSQWGNSKDPENFLVVTGQKVYTEPCGDEDWDEKLLTMGTKLEIVPETEGNVMTRNPMNNYVVKIPARDKTGYFYQKTAMIAANRDVHVGYLPYTTENVLHLAFDCIGNRYSWGGGVHGFDCSLYMVYIYRCFGIELPRNTTWQGRVPTEASFDMGSMTDEEKGAALDKLRPGSILIFSGHEMMYIGKYDGKYYVISALGKFVDPTEPENGVVSVYGIVINDLSALRANGNTWMRSLNHATVVE